LYLALIFLAGGISGAAVAWNSARHRSFGDRKEWKGRSRTMRDVCDQMRSRLQSRLVLTPEQAARIDPILDQTAKEMDAAHRRTIEQIEQILQKSDEEIAKYLTEEQKAKLQEMEKERREFKDKRFKGPPPKGSSL